jgi:hypothetical protein
MHAYIPDRVIITVDDEMGPYSRVYAVGHAGLSVCQVMSVPTFRTAVLAMLIQKVEVPKGVAGCFCPYRVGSAVLLVLSRKAT